MIAFATFMPIPSPHAFGHVSLCSLAPQSQRSAAFFVSLVHSEQFTRFPNREITLFSCCRIVFAKIRFTLFGTML